MSEADELAAVRKELATVKTRAVGKIKALQATVDDLTQQLAEKGQKSPPEVSSSEDGSEKGFVKVTEPSAALQRKERELEAREASLAQREEAVAQREEALAQQERELAPAAAAVPVWHSQLADKLRQVNDNLQQAQVACDSAGLPR